MSLLVVKPEVFDFTKGVEFLLHSNQFSVQMDMFKFERNNLDIDVTVELDSGLHFGMVNFENRMPIYVQDFLKELGFVELNIGTNAFTSVWKRTLLLSEQGLPFSFFSQKNPMIIETIFSY